MKDIITLETSQEVSDFVFNLWRTAHFRNSHNEPSGYINKLITKFSKIPRFFYTMTSKIEHSHFTTWFNAIALRPDYDNDAISDLYYLHEITHAATMYFDHNLSLGSWYEKTSLNEMLASLESEVFVYFELPNLREKSFKHKIWVDKFLNNSDNIKKYERPPNSVRENITNERILITQRENSNNFLEKQIINYTKQNLDWSFVWKNNWTTVEAQMTNFINLSKTNPTEAIKWHLWFLYTNTKNGVPFYEEAMEFYDIYKRNNAKYGNDLIIE